MKRYVKYFAVAMVSLLSVLPICVSIACGSLSILNGVILYVFCALGIFSLLRKKLSNNELDLNNDKYYKKLSTENNKHQEIKSIIQQLSLSSDVNIPNILIKKRLGDLPQIGIECVSHPSYTIIISEDLINRYKEGISEVQISLLISHELGHFFHRDHFWAEWILMSQGIYFIQSLIALGGALSFSATFVLAFMLMLGIGFVFQNLLSKMYSRFCEYTADSFAVRLCQNSNEMMHLFEHIARAYQYWGIAIRQNNFSEYKLYSDFQIAPLLELQYYLTSRPTLDEQQREMLFSLKKNLLQYYPFNIPQTSQSYTQYVLTWFNSYPTSEERRNKL